MLKFECPECSEVSILNVDPFDRADPLLTCPKCGYSTRPSQDAAETRERMRWRSKS